MTTNELRQTSLGRLLKHFEPTAYTVGGVGVAVANGYLYALGGHDCPASNPAVCRVETVERYDLGTDSWMLITSLSVVCAAIGVTLLGDRLIAAGGFDGNHYLKTVDEHDPETNEWSLIAPLNFSRAGACLVVIPNVLASAPGCSVF